MKKKMINATNRESFISLLKDFLWESNENIIKMYIDSAIAYINWYTFQQYCLSDFEDIPHDILSVIIELVKNKYHERIGIQSEKLSDYSITYSSVDLDLKFRVLLDKYRIISIE